jgi:hypothetical protein
MAKQIGIITFNMIAINGMTRIAASQDARVIITATDDTPKLAMAQIISDLQSMGLTGSLKRDIKAPMFTHDCLACAFLGHTDGHDHYACDADDNGNGSFVSRSSDQDSDYHSMPIMLISQMVCDPRAFAWLKSGWKLFKSRKVSS